MSPMLTTETDTFVARIIVKIGAEWKRERERETHPSLSPLFDCSSNAPHFSRPIFAVKLVIDN